MSTARKNMNERLRVNAYDRVSSWLVSLLVIMSVSVGSLLLLYFARQLRSLEFAPAIRAVSAGGGGGGGGGMGDAATELESELETGNISDAPEQINLQISDTLSALSTAVTSKADILTNDALDVPLEEDRGTQQGDNRRPGVGSGRGGGFGSGIGSGVGSGIGAGVGPGRGGPAEPRRELRFEPGNLSEYAQMLDYFGVELGVLSIEENQVYYASNLQQSAPSVRVGSPSDEERLHMIPTSGQFAALDRRLVERAGIGGRGKIVMQFYSAATQSLIHDLEGQFAEGRSRRSAQIRLTIIRVTRTGNQFSLSVEEQFYR